MKTFLKKILLSFLILPFFIIIYFFVFSAAVKADCTGTPRGCKTWITFIQCISNNTGNPISGKCSVCNASCGNNGYCDCATECTETYYKSCQVSGVICQATGCGLGTCGETAPNCYWTGGATPTPTPVPATPTPVPATPTPVPATPTPIPGCYSCGRCSANYPGYWADWTEANSACPAQSFCSGPNYTWDPVNCSTSTPTPIPGCTPCTGCASAGCEQCSSTADGWRCVCSGSCNGVFDDCGGVLDASCTTDSTPIPDDGDGAVECIPDEEYCGTCSVPCGGGTQSCTDGCDDWSQSCNTQPCPWWQVVDSDVVTNGNIVSLIYPAGEKFILDGIGGYPGVAVYGGNTADFQAGAGTGTVSSKGWLARTTSTWLTQKTYDYDYFRGLLPSDWWEAKIPITSGTINSFPTGSANDEGYIVYHHSGNLIINGAQTLGDNKVILFVEGGDLTINNTISFNHGTGFFMAVVEGNIMVGSLVSSLEGFYSADVRFKTGTGSVALTIKGSVIGLGGVLMQRDLGVGDKTTPAEKFEYIPAMIFTYPSKLGVRKMRWKEVAP